LVGYVAEDAGADGGQLVKKVGYDVAGEAEGVELDLGVFLDDGELALEDCVALAVLAIG